MILHISFWIIKTIKFLGDLTKTTAQPACQAATFRRRKTKMKHSLRHLTMAMTRLLTGLNLRKSPRLRNCCSPPTRCLRVQRSGTSKTGCTSSKRPKLSMCDTTLCVPVILFSKLNTFIFGYFGLESVLFYNENK